MANENKLTTIGQMKTFAQQQDSRDDGQDEKIQQLDEENDTFLKFTQQTLTDAQKAQARANIGAAAEGSTEPTAITEAQISALFAN